MKHFKSFLSFPSIPQEIKIKLSSVYIKMKVVLRNALLNTLLTLPKSMETMKLFSLEFDHWGGPNFANFYGKQH